VQLQAAQPSPETKAEWAARVADNLYAASAHAHEALTSVARAATANDAASYQTARVDAETALARLRQLGRAAKEHAVDAIDPVVRARLEVADVLVQGAEQKLVESPPAPVPAAPELRVRGALLAALPPTTKGPESTKLVFDRARHEVKQVLSGMPFSDITSLELILREFPTNEIAVRFNRFSRQVRDELSAMLRDGKVRARARAIEAAMPAPTPEAQADLPLPEIRTSTSVAVGETTVSILEPVAPAVDAAFAPAFKPHDQKHADSIKWMHDSLELADSDAQLIAQLARSYVAARDNVDAPATAELGGTLLGAFVRMRGATSALAELHAQLTTQSIAGTRPEQDLENAQLQQDVEARMAGVEQAVTSATTLAVLTLTPREFRGRRVTEQPLGIALDAPPEGIRAELQLELGHTLRVLDVARRVPAALATKHLVSQLSFDAGIYGEICALASRPIDLAFFKAIAGPQWNQLEATAPPQAKPSVALDQATKQATHTGWLADTGKFDIDDAAAFINSGDAMTALRSLYTTDDQSRGVLLLQLKQRKLLAPFCQQLGWSYVKKLHDSLSIGHAEIKTDLQAYFVGGTDKFGPSLDSEWNSHESSLHSLIGKLGPYGKLENWALDIATFGFHSQYAQARDANTSGMISDGDFHNAAINVANRTALTAVVAMITGGTADKFVRGGAATISTARAIAAGATGGVVGGLSGQLTNDAYMVYLSEEKEKFSSPEDYVKTALMAGAFGAAAGGFTHLSETSRAYLPSEMERTPPSLTDEVRSTRSELVQADALVSLLPEQRIGTGTAETKSGQESTTSKATAAEPAIATGSPSPVGLVMTEVPGVFKDTAPTQPQPPGWKLEIKPGSMGSKQLEITAPNGARGIVRRTFDRATGQWTMHEAFFDEGMPRWIEHGAPLVPGKGTPTIAFADMRLMNAFAIDAGSIKTVKMSTIENVQAICELEANLRKGMSLDDAVVGTHSVRYARTEIIQSGHTIDRVRVEGGSRTSFMALLEHVVNTDILPAKEVQRLLDKYAISPTDDVWQDYDIYLELSPTTKVTK
jgi:hypothetical protein